MRHLAMLAGISLISACAAHPPNTNISELDQARSLIAKAKAAGAERCAPERQAEAVVNLYAAAHELTEHDIHPDENEYLIAKSVKAAKQALGKAKRGCKAEVLNLDGVYFKTNSADLIASSTATLDRAVATLKKRSSIHVEVAAHTDSRGKAAYNMGLSERRAKSVMDYLTAHGIPASRLTSHGYGETQSVADNGTSAGRAMNRRVELRVR